MKENKVKLDDVFKDLFEDFEVSPSEEVWHNVNANIPDYKPNAGFFKWSAAVFSSLLIVGVILFINDVSPQKEEIVLATNQKQEKNSAFEKEFHINSETKESENNINLSKEFLPITEKQTIQQQEKSTTANTESSLAVTELSEVEERSSFVEKKEILTEDYSSDLAPKESVILTFAEEIDQTNEHSVNLSHSMENNSQNQELLPAEKKLSSERLALFTMPSIAPSPIEISQDGLLAKQENKVLKDYVFTPNWTVGLHFAYENIRYEMATSPKNMNFSHNYTLSVAYNERDFFVESGLMYSKVDDNGDYYVHYTSYDFLGAYQQVDSFTVVQDSIVYHTSDIHVYDSIEHVSYSKTKHLYHYLTIPINIGYKWHLKQMDVGLKAGFAYQFQLKEQAPDVVSNYADVELIEVMNLTPKRFQSNVYYSAAAFVHYNMTERLKLNIEPTLRFYSRSFYKNYFDTRNPYSFSLRIGVIYDF
jgi:hypothetical protein